ncbi:ParB/RepB/Spo0J family partition protein [Pararhodobacter zhoushanensis]|uniref:ParB N-terminal domain-containing protein n=1 Tax=Pararhodobacter zhoushanensis TaxID=2479545 RepID=A0ABT3H319_9RHOB|nr:ParB N-terminal domain-containing protein [Pararhodobacter zhoushanensis]MCW1934093.1 ParB N-terminal domain-containing protein [Pararhodobacter zhoushanensis]
MAEPRLLKIDRVKIADVDTTGRMRPLSEAGVLSLLTSIEETGILKDAIHVRQKKGGQLVLIAGGHRLEAAQRLGWDTIEAKVWADVTDDWAQLIEIDDNIAGAQLNPLDTAIFLAERKRIYEKLHPETKRGVAGAAARWDATDTMSVASFADATAEKFGLSQRHIFRVIAAGAHLDPRDIAKLRKAPRQITLEDLAHISKISHPDERDDVVEALSEGRAKNAATARAQWKAEQGVAPAIEDPVEAALKALKTAWSRAPKEARRRFCRDHGDDLAALLYEGSPE